MINIETIEIGDLVTNGNIVIEVDRIIEAIDQDNSYTLDFVGVMLPNSPTNGEGKKHMIKEVDIVRAYKFNHLKDMGAS